MAYDTEHGKLWQDIKADLDKIRARSSKFAHDAEWALGRRTARVLGVVVLFAVAVALLLVFLDLYIAPTKPGDNKDLILALAQILAGTALLSGLYFTWRGQRLTQKNTQSQLQLTEQGQITERFTRAIDQLGATDDKTGEPRLEIRLGSIYALERIDKESHERAYHGTVMEVLTAYVRENSQWEPKEPSTSTTAPNAGVKQDKGGEQDAQPTLRGLPTDIQAILEVLKRRQEQSVPEEHRVILDLRGTNLPKADFFGADLPEANLQGANLQQAYLMEANFSGANLEHANLQGAVLGAYLQQANLRQANLQGANLQGADLQGADLQGADLENANLHKANGITEDQIEWTIGSNETKLGEDLNRPELWSKSYEEQWTITRAREHLGGASNGSTATAF